MKGVPANARLSAPGEREIHLRPRLERLPLARIEQFGHRVPIGLLGHDVSAGRAPQAPVHPDQRQGPDGEQEVRPSPVPQLGEQLVEKDRNHR